MQTNPAGRRGAGFRPRTAVAGQAVAAVDAQRPETTAVVASTTAGLGSQTRTGQGRGWLLFAALLWLAFCIYGSLVPLNYRPLSWEHAWQSFQHIRYLDLGVGSRADWVANILLFIPLGFLWTGVLWPTKGIALRLLVVMLVFGLAVLLSLSIEFSQLFFPPRTVSQNDIIAETIGAAIGIGLWLWLGGALIAWISAWQREHSGSGVAGRLFWLYLALLFGYNLLPLDLTISPIEIYHKWQLGRVVLIPFSYPGGTLAEQIYGVLADIVIWIPAAILLLLSRRKSAWQTWSWLFGVVLLLEVLQLLVWSRVSDTTDLITGGIGVGIGVLLGLRWQRGTAPVAAATAKTRWFATSLMFVAWVVVLAAVFWYPYNFQTDWAFLRDRAAALNRSPLHIYYYGTEFRAITEVIHKLGFFIPLGMIVAWLRVSMQAGVPRRLLDLSMLMVLPAIALLIELGQVALPGKYPDITDWVLESVGALGAYVGSLYLVAKIATTDRSNTSEKAAIRRSQAGQTG